MNNKTSKLKPRFLLTILCVLLKARLIFAHTLVLHLLCLYFPILLTRVSKSHLTKPETRLTEFKSAAQMAQVVRAEPRW